MAAVVVLIESILDDVDEHFPKEESGGWEGEAFEKGQTTAEYEGAPMLEEMRNCFPVIS